jgi:hypothetical protein
MKARGELRDLLVSHNPEQEKTVAEVESMPQEVYMEVATTDVFGGTLCLVERASRLGGG